MEQQKHDVYSSAKVTFPPLVDNQAFKSVKNMIIKTVLEMDTFFEFIANADKPVLVDFWALWCAPCAGMIPIYEEIAAEQDSFYVAKVNVDKCKPLASQYSIMVIPTAVLFKDGKPVASLEGTASKEDILGSIGQFL